MPSIFELLNKTAEGIANFSFSYRRNIEDISTPGGTRRALKAAAPQPARSCSRKTTYMQGHRANYFRQTRGILW